MPIWASGNFVTKFYQGLFSCSLPLRICLRFESAQRPPTQLIILVGAQVMRKEKGPLNTNWWRGNEQISESGWISNEIPRILSSITKPCWNSSSWKLDFQHGVGLTNGSGTLTSMAPSLSPQSSCYDRSNKSILSFVPLITELLIDLSLTMQRPTVMGLYWQSWWGLQRLTKRLVPGCENFVLAPT